MLGVDETGGDPADPLSGGPFDQRDQPGFGRVARDDPENFAVRHHASCWANALVPLSFNRSGRQGVRVKVAHVRLCHSRMFHVRAYSRESQGMVSTRTRRRPFPSDV